MTFVERRKQERHVVWIDAAVQTPGTSSLTAIVTEISGGGIRIQSQKPVFPDTNIIISLKIEEENEFFGAVEWTLNLMDTKKAYYMGVIIDVIVFEGIRINKVAAKAEVVEKIIAGIS